MKFEYSEKPGLEPVSYKTGTLSLDQLKNSINTNAPAGMNSVVLVFDPSANTDERTAAAHALKDTNGNTFYLPANARVWDGFYVVITTFASPTSDAATISLGHADDVAGIKAAVAISDGTNPYDSGTTPKAIIQVGTVAAAGEKTTAARTINATIGVEAVTAGKLYLFLEYVVTPS